MKKYNKKVIVLVVIIISFINVGIYTKNYKNYNETLATMVKEVKEYGFVDALEIIFSYEDLSIEEIEMGEESCKYRLSFNGDYNKFVPVVNYIKGFKQVISIDNINILSKEKVCFDLTLIKNK